ncbi:hypothetical protein [Streptomyces sp. 7N604]|uniref:hypothetical protein n=1 Tax=Streptomyces sp. 7N604 TaxID=3457415 RepID=UPI003FD1C1EB
MQVSLGRGGRGVLCAMSSVAVTIALPQSVAVPAGKEESQVPFVERYRAVQRGGIARAANASATCETPVSKTAMPCDQVQRGGAGSNDHYEMTYIDVDKDPNTYNSSRAELRLPKGATVTYARLYWGGNLLAGEQKPAKDNNRVLFAEPGGQYKEVLADSTIGHRTADGSDAYAASADVTNIVRYASPGAYTVGQINMAKGHSDPGTYGGWALVVAYADPSAPMRTLALWDGFETLTPERREHFLDIDDLHVPAKGKGGLGVVAYDGDRGFGSNALAVAAGSAEPVPLLDAANPADEAMNSTISDRGRSTPGRQPAHMNTLGFDSDVFDLQPALAAGAEHLRVGFGTQEEGYHLGALFLQADARP